MEQQINISLGFSIKKKYIHLLFLLLNRKEKSTTSFFKYKNKKSFTMRNRIIGMKISA